MYIVAIDDNCCDNCNKAYSVFRHAMKVGV